MWLVFGMSWSRCFWGLEGRGGGRGGGRGEWGGGGEGGEGINICISQVTLRASSGKGLCWTDTATFHLWSHESQMKKFTNMKRRRKTRKIGGGKCRKKKCGKQKRWRRRRKRGSESTCTAAVFVPSHPLLVDRGDLSALLSYTYWLSTFTQNYNTYKMTSHRKRLRTKKRK